MGCLHDTGVPTNDQYDEEHVVLAPMATWRTQLLPAIDGWPGSIVLSHVCAACPLLTTITSPPPAPSNLGPAACSACGSGARSLTALFCDVAAEMFYFYFQVRQTWPWPPAVSCCTLTVVVVERPVSSAWQAP